MATVEFNFNLWWTMGKACGTSTKASYNPAPNKGPGIYIIHNSNVENTTYVGYADNCYHRWNGRTEVFHTLGIPKAYAKNVLCAFCLPSVDQGKSMWLEGMNNCEHLLIRAVVNGLLGVTTNTNSQLAYNASCDLQQQDRHARACLPPERSLGMAARPTAGRRRGEFLASPHPKGFSTFRKGKRRKSASFV
jgi:hypothetical protein